MTGERQTPHDPITSELVKNDASFADIVAEFVEGLHERVRTMDEAIHAGDFEALRLAAHQLKGSGGGYGYPILSEWAGELERRANARILEDCMEALSDLKDICERVIVEDDQ